MGAVLDIRGLEEQEARELIGRQFAGAGLCDEVLCIVKAEEIVYPWHGFDMSGERVFSRPLIVDPDRVLFMLRKRSCKRPLDPSVVAFMTSEHERVFMLIAALTEAANTGQSIGAETFLDLLGALLRRHIEVEESLLMPILSSRHGQQRGPAAVLRGDHIAVMEMLEELSELVGTVGELPKVAETTEDLKALLLGHVEVEEEVVYRLADQNLDDEERASLLDFCYSMA